jgi:beta-glucosidase
MAAEGTGDQNKSRERHGKRRTVIRMSRPVTRRRVLQGGATLGIVGAAWSRPRAEETQPSPAAAPYRTPGSTPVSTRMTPTQTARIDKLIAAMTLEEKIGQLTMLSADFSVTGPRVSANYVGEIRAGRAGSLLNLWGVEAVRAAQRMALEETRLGIPLLLGFDVVHGHRTIFPVPLAEAAAFDAGLWQSTARAAAVEAAADGLALVFAPMLDVSRDPRWGRIVEGPGEDPWVGARLAEAKIRGFETGDLSRADAVAATAKHFVAYGAVTAGRDYASVEVSERALHEIYLPPFAAAVATGVATVMPSFVDLAGVPASADVPLLRDLLRTRWGFDGVIISDYNAIAELIAHGVAGDVAEAAALALNAGIDIDMMAEAYKKGLPTALERGRVSEAQVDEAVRRVLVLKTRLGLFDDPYRRGTALAPAQREAHRALARDAARRSIVLLTNRNGALPLSGETRRLGVIGPLAEAPQDMLGSWAGAAGSDGGVTFVDGLRAALPAAEILRAQGVPVSADDKDGIPAALEMARSAEAILLCVGEAAPMSGEAASRARPDLPGRQRELAEAVLNLGKPVVVLLSSGRPLMVPWLFERADAVVAVWHLGSEAGNAVADVLTGAWNPSGRLPLSWPVDVGQIPIFYAQRATGRPSDPKVHYSSKYIDLPVEPLFPFGHGLSYTRFAYRGIRAMPEAVRPGDTIAVEVEIANEGPVAGEETAFLFIRDPVASVARPLLELKGTQKIALDAGMRGTVRFELSTDALAFPGAAPDYAPRLEPGDFELHVGPSADRAVLLKASIRLLGS